MNRVDELRGLVVRLKCGEYDGTDVMLAWLAIRDMCDMLEEQAPKDANLVEL